MARHRENQGTRKSVRVDLHQPGFLIPAPEAAWIECLILEVSDEGVCLDVGALSVPGMFGLAFTAGGEVLRVCSLDWRKGEHRRPLCYRQGIAAGICSDGSSQFEDSNGFVALDRTASGKAAPLTAIFRRRRYRSASLFATRHGTAFVGGRSTEPA